MEAHTENGNLVSYNWDEIILGVLCPLAVALLITPDFKTDNKTEKKILFILRKD